MEHIVKMLKNKIIQKAQELGFDLVGFAPAQLPPKYLTAFHQWLEKKHEGNMSYMQKLDQRKNIEQILPGTKTVISLAVNYYYPQQSPKEGEGVVARYAYGRDYHKVIKKWLRSLEKFIKELAPEEETKAYVDTGPILERAYAEEAGLGVIGKNTCLITEEYGSWVFLAEVLTTLELAPDTKKSTPSKDFSACGACRACIDACPTGAIIAPGVVDARRCLSYLTIEHRDEIPKKFQKAIALTKRVYGCDICQEVCPHNHKKAQEHSHQALKDPKIAGPTLSAPDLQKIETSDQYLARFAGSALMRPKKEGLQRNLKALTGE